MVKAKSAGGFLGGILNNPGAVVIALGLGALLFFRGDIRKAFGSIGEGFGQINLPDITLPTINLPEIKFPEFPAFPEFPDFGNLFSGFQTQLDTITKQLSNLDQPGREMGTTTMTESGIDTTGGLADRQRDARDAIAQAEAERALMEAGPIGGSEFATAINQTEFERRRDAVLESNMLIPQTGFDVGETSVFGGGPSFIGGTTTFGSNLVDTLSEVLNIFPNLSASQARDALSEFPGLTGNEFAQIDPDVINITRLL